MGTVECSLGRRWNTPLYDVSSSPLMLVSSGRSGACFPRPHVSTRFQRPSGEPGFHSENTHTFFYIARITAHHDMLSPSSFFFLPRLHGLFHKLCNVRLYGYWLARATQTEL